MITPSNRMPGRPPRRTRPTKRPAAGNLDRRSILAHTLDMTRKERLSLLSIVRISESLKVRPGALHYHLQSREALITGVINLFYKSLLEQVDAGDREPALSNEIKRIALIWFEMKLEFPGIAHYMATEDRFRVFQNPMPGETDYGAAFMDRFFGLFERAGESAQLAATTWHQIALLTTSAASDIAFHHSPSDHSTFLSSQIDRHKQLPGLTYGLNALATVDAKTAFVEVIERAIDRLPAAKLRS